MFLSWEGLLIKAALIGMEGLIKRRVNYWGGVSGLFSLPPPVSPLEESEDWGGGGSKVGGV